MLGSESMTGTSGERSIRLPRGRDERPAGNATWALPVIAVGVMIAILYWARLVFINAIVAVIIALILEPFVSLLVKLRIPRGIASFVVCGAALLVLYFAALTAWHQLSTISSDFPALR